MSKYNQGFHDTGTSDTQQTKTADYAPQPIDCQGDPSKDATDVRAVFKRQTNLAVLFTLPDQGYKEQWVPKKCLVRYDEINQLAEIHDWFIKKNDILV